MTGEGDYLLEVWFEACSGFFVVFLVMGFSIRLAWEQIARSWSLGIFQSKWARLKNVWEHPSRGFLSVTLSFIGVSSRISLLGVFLSCSLTIEG